MRKSSMINQYARRRKPRKITKYYSLKKILQTYIKNSIGSYTYIGNKNTNEK